MYQGVSKSLVPERPRFPRQSICSSLKFTGGATGQLYSGWRQKLIRIMGHVEAYIDFGEDEGIEADTIANALHQVRLTRAG